MEPDLAGSPHDAGLAGPGVAFTFDNWLGDDVVRAYPAVLVTTPVRDALLKATGLNGFTLARARTRLSGFFRKHSPGKRLPPFWAVVVRGAPGRDDMGLTPAGVLVVSQRVLDVFLDFRIPRASFAQYSPS